MYKYSFLLFVALFFCACGVKQQPIEISSPVKVTIKSPNIKLSGLGFYKKGGDYVNLQVFTGAVATLNYKSSTTICINDNCMTRGIFNDKFFMHAHYAALIDEILAGKPIYNSQNLTKTQNGFSQSVTKNGEYNIFYEVINDNVEFEDSKNGVYLRLKKLEKMI
ncbi:MAG: hypothetical protein LBT96_04820 [Campylobacteraceae bacterium]|jgi:hypothetical protein|nr:hypothetical protein [Campylobacteraceae bacterium]